jgi:hypothetical protein
MKLLYLMYKQVSKFYFKIKFYFVKLLIPTIKIQ